MKFETVYTDKTKYHESVPSEYEAIIVPNKFIVIRRKLESGTYTEPVRFNIGDQAEYDSYNLKYLGTITQITNKRITIDPGYSQHKKSLKLYNFCWRNYNFNLEYIQKENFETMMYI